MSYEAEIFINTEFQAQTNLELHLPKFPVNYVDVSLFSPVRINQTLPIHWIIRATQDLYPEANVSDASFSLCILNLAIMWSLSGHGYKKKWCRDTCFLPQVFLKDKNSAYTTLICTKLKLPFIASIWDAYSLFGQLMTMTQMEKYWGCGWVGCGERERIFHSIIPPP